RDSARRAKATCASRCATRKLACTRLPNESRRPGSGIDQLGPSPSWSISGEDRVAAAGAQRRSPGHDVRRLGVERVPHTEQAAPHADSYQRLAFRPVEHDIVDMVRGQITAQPVVADGLLVVERVDDSVAVDPGSVGEEPGNAVGAAVQDVAWASVSRDLAA